MCCPSSEHHINELDKSIPNNVKTNLFSVGSSCWAVTHTNPIWGGSRIPNPTTLAVVSHHSRMASLLRIISDTSVHCVSARAGQLPRHPSESSKQECADDLESRSRMRPQNLGLQHEREHRVERRAVWSWALAFFSTSFSRNLPGAS